MSLNSSSSTHASILPTSSGAAGSTAGTQTGPAASFLSHCAVTLAHAGHVGCAICRQSTAAV